jgi:molecular chaperone DnaK
VPPNVRPAHDRDRSRHHQLRRRILDGREPKIIVNPLGARLTPSVVAKTAKGELLVGEVARRQAATNPENTIHSVKRFIGRRYAELGKEVSRLAYKTVADPEGQCGVLLAGKTLSCAHISAHVLDAIRQAAEAQLGESVTQAVVTVPAYFTDAQRQATMHAAKLAGLEVKRIINEPTAAALAYGLDKTHDRTLAVYDFGGGTLDVSILKVSSEGLLEVIATHGDTHLGGDDMDQRIVGWMTSQLRGRLSPEAAAQPVTRTRLREAAEQAKIALTMQRETQVLVPFLSDDRGTPIHFDAVLERSTFEELIEDLVERSLNCCAQALTAAGRHARDVDEVILVGGTSRIPAVQRAVKELFGKEPQRTVNPDEVVALGAAVQAGVLAGSIKGLILIDVTSHSLGIETVDGTMAVMVPRNTSIPTRTSQVFTTASDNQPSVDLHVLQGEQPQASRNTSLGRWELGGIRQAQAGVPQIDVSFEIDANGVVNVTAQDKDTRAMAKVTVHRRRTGSDPAPAAGSAATAMVAQLPGSSHFDEVLRLAQKCLSENNALLGATQRERLEAAIVDAQLLARKQGRPDDLRRGVEELARLTREAESAAASPRRR